MTHELQRELMHFTGTETWHRSGLFRKFLYTDGIKHLAEKAGCYWLIDLIFGCQIEHKEVRSQGFQTWDLIVNEDDSAWLICTDGNRNDVHKRKIVFTDFPLKEIRLFFTDDVLMLPSEY